jgi:hypothetical protein
MKNNKTKSRVLILTSSGGGGLLQAAKAKEQECIDDNPEAFVLVKDIMITWFGWFGIWGVGSWNSAQKKGNVTSQENFAKIKFLSDIFFWPTAFFCALYTLLRHRIDRVIDTQPVATSALIKAMRIVNRITGKKLILEKVLVDLPTYKCTHFYCTIKYMSKKDKSFLKIVTIEPLLENEKDNKEFWKKYCNITEDSVQYENTYIRRGFKQYIGKKRDETNPFNVSITANKDKEFDLIARSLTKSRAKFTKSNKGFDFAINPKDKLFVILLGSQPCIPATCAYVRNFIDLVKNHASSDRHFHLFVYCSKFSDSKKELFRKVVDIIEKYGKYPSNLSVIPMAFQDSDIIASLFFRSDITITRSGGQTMMELMNVASGSKWVHSEAKPPKNGNKVSYYQLIKGIPAWEAANAQYLERKDNGSFVTPYLLEEMAKPLL